MSLIGCCPLDPIDLTAQVNQQDLTAQKPALAPFLLFPHWPPPPLLQHRQLPPAALFVLLHFFFFKVN
ncbi:hypothetical protein Taro_026835 [Colocasia esculenta]|uniref:Uncharacterized protein n=1 Tax=Colocasia esculenta TaxID=4460 RepID=A0A843VCF0_COLES|nr:hypothetical protein [Colocasia esculenta]